MDSLDDDQATCTPTIVMTSAENEQEEVMELLLGGQQGTEDQHLTVSLETESVTDSAFDTNPISHLSDGMDDDTQQSGLHIGEGDEVDDNDDEVPVGVVIKSENTSSSTATILDSGIDVSGAGVLQITANGQVLFAPAHSDSETATLQTITLSDGTTAYLHQSAKDDGTFQTVELEDGTTALVSAGNVTMPQISKSDTNIIGAKLLEGQTVQLEDGTTAFIQASSVKASEHLQPVKLEDGTTAYLTANLFADTHMDSDLIVNHQHEKNIGEDKCQLSLTLESGSKLVPSRPPSERALALGEKAFRCLYDGCGRLYTTQHHLKIHERSHTGDKPFKCEVESCPRAFATSYGLKSHIRVHTGEKPYKCPMDECPKAFKTSGDLQKHIRTHTGEKPFKCPFEGCDRAFTTSNIRRVHIRTHTGERPYVCTYKDCGKAFASATNYKNHIRIHSGEKPYVCNVPSCGKRFTEYSSLYKHHVVHTHSKPYECSHCGKTYRQTSTLSMHKRTAHGEDSDVELVLSPQLESTTDEHVQTQVAVGVSEVRTEEGDGNLVINTSADTQQGAKLALFGNNKLGNVSQSLHNQTGLALAELNGQQIFVVTDPSQLEMIQQLTQHAKLILKAGNSDETIVMDASQEDDLSKSEQAEQTVGESSFINVNCDNRF